MRAMLVGSLIALLAGTALAQDAADPLAELAALANEASANSPEGGGSIRAKKDADVSALARLKDAKNLEGRVESVVVKGFPIVAVPIKVVAPAKEGSGKDVKKNDTVIVTPKFKLDGKNVALADPDTLINAGAFYLKKGDKVAIRLGANKGKYWEADYIERK